MIAMSPFYMETGSGPLGKVRGGYTGLGRMVDAAAIENLDSAAGGNDSVSLEEGDWPTMHATARKATRFFLKAPENSSTY